MTNERPIVTFAVFAYNQERFIREAVEGALAQEYSPLEVILSDDGSTDRTFDITREIAASYRGPHDVHARRTARNLGLLNHVLDVAGVAKGGLLVVSAGDDVSLPERTGALVNRWLQAKSGALYSAYVPMGNDSALLDVDPKAQGLDRTIPYLGGSGEMLPLVLGATAAYDIEFLRGVAKPSEKIFHEDIIFTNMARLQGWDVSFVDEALVKYRFADLSNEGRLNLEDVFRSVLDWEQRANARARDYGDVLRYMDAILTAEEGSKNWQVLSAHQAENEFTSEFVNGGLLRRLALVGTCRNQALLRWAVPRLFGLKAFSAAKALAKTVRSRQEPGR